MCSSLECPSPCNPFHRKPYPWCATFCPSITSIFSLLPICGKDIQQLPYTQTVVHHGHNKACSKKLVVHKKGPKRGREVVGVQCRPQKRPETWTGNRGLHEGEPLKALYVKTLAKYPAFLDMQDTRVISCPSAG